MKKQICIAKSLIVFYEAINLVHWKIETREQKMEKIYFQIFSKGIIPLLKTLKDFQYFLYYSHSVLFAFCIICIHNTFCIIQYFLYYFVLFAVMTGYLYLYSMKENLKLHNPRIKSIFRIASLIYFRCIRNTH